MKTFLLLLSIAGGILFPYGHDYTFLIRYFLMVLLFFAFLEVKLDKEIITTKHFVILFTIILSSLVLFFVVNNYDNEIAQAAFITAIGPTAIAAPVVISLKKGKVEFVTFALLLNNIVITILIPFLLPVISSNDNNVTMNDVLFPVIETLTIPFLAAQIIKYVLTPVWRVLVGWKDSSFYLLILNIYIATSDASDYIRNDSPDHLSSVLFIAMISGLICLFMFSLGWFIGGKKYAAEASQSLGQKNNAFTMWIALTYMNPVAVIGPIFYVFFQNIYVSYELFIHNLKTKEKQKLMYD